MFDRRYLKGFLLVGLALSLVGCDSPTLVSIAITPTAEYFIGTSGQAQFTAIGTFDQGNHPKTTQDITDEVTWTSNAPSIATISSAGVVVVAGQADGATVITASMNGFTGLIIAHATATVCPVGDTASTTGCTASSSISKSK
jgi:hypothetical protein